jgi:hypothetical protein
MKEDLLQDFTCLHQKVKDKMIDDMNDGRISSELNFVAGAIK